jgi:hypothetical protein
VPFISYSFAIYKKSSLMTVLGENTFLCEIIMVYVFKAYDIAIKQYLSLNDSTAICLILLNKGAFKNMLVEL